MEWVILILIKMNQAMLYFTLATVAWRAWRPTRFARPTRVKGRHVLQATVLPNEVIHVAASGNAMLCKESWQPKKLFWFVCLKVKIKLFPCCPPRQSKQVRLHWCTDSTPNKEKHHLISRLGSISYAESWKIIELLPRISRWCRSLWSGWKRWINADFVKLDRIFLIIWKLWLNLQ